MVWFAVEPSVTVSVLSVPPPPSLSIATLWGIDGGVWNSIPTLPSLAVTTFFVKASLPLGSASNSSGGLPYLAVPGCSLRKACLACALASDFEAAVEVGGDRKSVG